MNQEKKGCNYIIRRGLLSERSEICGKHCATHLAASVRNELELNNQISELKTDFPCLFSNELFEKCFCWVATSAEDRNIIGSIVLADSYSENNPILIVFELQSFSVDSNWRRLGVGKALMNAALNYAYDNGIDEITLLTLKDVMQSAINLYTSFKFKVYKESIGGSYNLLHMSLNREDLTIVLGREKGPKTTKKRKLENFDEEVVESITKEIYNKLLDYSHTKASKNKPEASVALLGHFIEWKKKYYNDLGPLNDFLNYLSDIEYPGFESFKLFTVNSTDGGVHFWISIVASDESSKLTPIITTTSSSSSSSNKINVNKETFESDESLIDKIFDFVSKSSTRVSLDIVKIHLNWDLNYSLKFGDMLIWVGCMMLDDSDLLNTKLNLIYADEKIYFEIFNDEISPNDIKIDRPLNNIICPIIVEIIKSFLHEAPLKKLPVVVISEKLNWVGNFQPKLGTFHLWIGKQVTQQIDPFFPNLKVLGSDGILHIELKANQQLSQIKTTLNDTPGNKLLKVIIPDSYSSGDTIAITSIEGVNITAVVPPGLKSGDEFILEYTTC